MSNPYNLIHAAWMPVRRASGRREWIAPWCITDGLSEDPIVALDWSRPDLNGGTLELLIGLLTTALAPKDVYGWRAVWKEPPTPDALKQAFDALAFAFDLDGDGPRFLQELGAFEEASERNIAQLLIEQPGQQAVERNAAHFVKQGVICKVSRAAAAAALYTVQAYSPAGGSGFRTSMRGGGPLTTIMRVDPPSGPTSLWRHLWPNVPCREWPDWRAQPAAVFPWLAPTRTSADGTPTTPAQAHWLQHFWGMPRRIRLRFEPAAGRACDLDGPVDDVCAVGWDTRQHGVRYEGWLHPLTPYSQPKPNLPPNPAKGNPGGITYRHWLGLVQEDAEHGRSPAACVRVFRWDRVAAVARDDHARLMAFGYDMDNMKARCWYQSEIPIPLVADAEARQRMEALAEQLVRAADEASRRLRFAVKRAQFQRPADHAADFAHLGERFWHDTEMDFISMVRRAVETEDMLPLRQDWLARLRDAALTIFDDTLPSVAIEEGAWRRMVEARRWLAIELSGKKIRAEIGLAELPAARGRGRRGEGRQ